MANDGKIFDYRDECAEYEAKSINNHLFCYDHQLNPISPAIDGWDTISYLYIVDGEGAKYIASTACSSDWEPDLLEDMADSPELLSKMYFRWDENYQQYAWVEPDELEHTMKFINLVRSQISDNK